MRLIANYRAGRISCHVFHDGTAHTLRGSFVSGEFEGHLWMAMH